jgi:hypothetical protein
MPPFLAAQDKHGFAGLTAPANKYIFILTLGGFRMRKLFRAPVYAGIILVLIALAGCQNILDQSEGLSAPGNEEQATAARAVAVPPIPIRSDIEFALIGKDSNYPLYEDYILTTDLILRDWKPIGDENHPFTGTFNGDNHKLNLQGFDSDIVDDNAYIGIFAYVAGDPNLKASLTNIYIVSSVAVRLEDGEFPGQAVGLLAGYTENTLIDGITLNGTFGYLSPVNIYVGGIVGYAQIGTVIQNSATSVVMTVDGGSGDSVEDLMFYNTVGGIVGLFKDDVDILNCSNTGAVTADCSPNGAQVFCGGIAGGSYYYFTTEYQGSIENCYSTGNITAKAKGFWSWAGGIAGCIVGDGNGKSPHPTRIWRCWASGTVSVENSQAGFPYVGGIVGYNYYGALVSQCYFNGNVLSNTDGNYTGGIAGYNSQTKGHNSIIEDCWSYGTVRGLHNAGGIVGQNQVETYVRRCYSRARVITLGDCSVNKSTTNPGLGGIAGFNASSLPDSITGCVALNAQITAADGSDIHRVVGRSTTATLSNNLGLKSLVPYPGDGSYTPDEGLAGKDGQDTANDPPIQAEYADLGWDFTITGDVWDWGASDRYPKLRWQTAPIPPDQPPVLPLSASVSPLAPASI